MSDYVFPFSGENDLNHILFDNLIPFGEFSSRISLTNEDFSNNTSNSHDEIDCQISNDNLVNCSYYN